MNTQLTETDLIILRGALALAINTPQPTYHKEELAYINKKRLALITKLNLPTS